MVRWHRFIASALVITVSLLAQAITPEQKADVLKGVTRVLDERAFVPGLDLAAWDKHVEKHQKELDDAATAEAYAKALNKACREFGISHLSVRTPDQEKRRTTRQSAGFGIRVADGEHVLHVIEVNPNGPSWGKGIEAGDEILEVDGKIPEEIEDLQGDVGSKSTLKLRKTDGTVAEVLLERKTFSVDRPDVLTWIDDESAVLRIHTFMQGYKRPEVTKLCKEASKAKYLLLDLRGNGGGQISNLRHLLGHFLPKSTPVGAFIGKNVVNRFKQAGLGDGHDPIAVAAWSPRKFRTDPLVEPVIKARVGVLVDRGSGSASEITAAALREVLDAPLVGTRSAGAVLASTYAQLEGGWGLQYPASDYVTIFGRRLEKNPLLPDLEVAAASRPARGTSTRPLPAPSTRPADDVAVRKGLELLKSRTPHPKPLPVTSRPSSEPDTEGGDEPPNPESRPRRGN